MPQRTYSKKTITYRRATWLKRPDATITLQKAVELLHDSLCTVQERVIQRSDGGIIFTNRLEKSPTHCRHSGICFEIVSLTRGQAAEVATTASLESAFIPVNVQMPEIGKDYVDARGFAVVYDDHAIITTTTRLRDVLFNYYFQMILNKIYGQKHGLQLSRVARMDQLEAIHKYGVKSIQLRMSMYNETTSVLSRTAKPSIFLRVAHFIKDQVVHSGDDVDVAQLADLQCGVTLHFGRRGSKLSRTALVEMAQDVAQEGESDYIIVLGNNIKLTPETIVQSKMVSVPSDDGRLDQSALWQKMHNYLEDLDDINALES